MCRLRNIAMRDYQESVTIGQTHAHTDRQTLDKVIPMCRYASQATQKVSRSKGKDSRTLSQKGLCTVTVGGQWHPVWSKKKRF